MRKSFTKGAKKAFDRIVELVLPAEMSRAEYILRCQVNGVNVDVSDEAYMFWIFYGVTKPENDQQIVKALKPILKQSIRNRWFFDFKNEDDAGFLMSWIVDLTPGDKYYSIEIIEMILGEDRFKGSKLYDDVKRFNKAVGLTSAGYFND